jgi:hypothetical protein
MELKVKKEEIIRRGEKKADGF